VSSIASRTSGQDRHGATRSQGHGLGRRLRPVENLRIAVAAVLEGKEDDNSFGGGTYAGPAFRAMLAA